MQFKRDLVKKCIDNHTSNVEIQLKILQDLRDIILKICNFFFFFFYLVRVDFFMAVTDGMMKMTHNHSFFN